MTERSLDLETLRRRWRDEGSPQLAVGLAEECARAGQVEEALEVLRTALDERPDHVAARVALGRHLVRRESWSEAATELERVVEGDPTHLVANKLLVEIYGKTGDRRRAQNRLDLYEVLNPDDPDLDELRRLVGGASEEDEEPVPAAAEDAEPPGEADAEAGEEAPQAVGEPEAGIQPGLEAGLPAEAEGEIQPEAEAGPSAEAEAEIQPEPEAGLPAEAEAEEEAAATLPDEVEEAELGEPEPRPAAAEAAAPGPKWERRGRRPAADGDPFPGAWADLDPHAYWRSLEGDLLYAAPPSAAPPSVEPAPSVEPPPEAEEAREAAAPEPEPEAEVAAVGEAPLEGPEPAPEPVPEAGPPAGVERLEAEAPAAAEPPSVPGVEPEAEAELPPAEAAAAPRAPLTAADLVGEETLAGMEPQERRAAVLRAYLARIRPQGGLGVQG